MRIYEVDRYYHIDLGKVVAIRQYINRTKSKDRKGRVIYEYWIEVTIDSGRFINIECTSLDKMAETYELLLRAWQTYVGDTDEPAVGIKIPNHVIN